MGEQGTSFASPVVAGKIGKLMAASPQIHPHMARALLIHHATPDESISQDEQGFGFCPNDVTEVLNCSDKKLRSYTRGKFHQKLLQNCQYFSQMLAQLTEWLISLGRFVPL